MRIFLVLGILSLALVLSACGDSSPLFNTPLAAPTSAPNQPNVVAPNAAPKTPLPQASQCQSQIQGSVLDEQGQLVHEGSVDISNGAVAAQAIVDPNGRYGFAGLCAGNYSITLTLLGRPRPLSDRVIVDGANKVKFDIHAR